jgi:hypothetical protein
MLRQKIIYDVMSRDKVKKLATLLWFIVGVSLTQNMWRGMVDEYGIL